ncbi:MAG: replicative DNA helicase [Desulfovibrio sp.]|nr:replicative DNA helicase [Desulfovibrio sp.]
MTNACSMPIQESGQASAVVRRADEDLLGRVPPHSVEAEQGVLAGLIHYPHMHDEILPMLEPTDFYVPRHAVLYRAYQDILGAGHPLDPALLLEHLRGRGMLEAAGGAEYLNELLQRRSSGAGAPKLAKVVAAKARQRQLIFSCARIMDEAYGMPWDQTDRLLDQAEQTIFSIAEQQAGEQEPPCFREATDDFCDELEDKILEPVRFRGFRMGWPSLDRIVGGIRRGSMTVLAARPSVGKTAAALNIARSFADAGLRVLFCSLEMTKRECLARMVAATSGTPLGHILEPDGRLTEAEIDRIYASSGRLDTTIWIDDTAALSVQSLRAMVRRLAARHGLDAVCVDYLQLMTPPPGAPVQTEVDRITAVSQGLKAIAKEFGVAVVALAQLNRSMEYREDHRPKYSDLRGSGSIEQEADVIIAMSRPFQTPLADVPVTFDVIKNRQGRTGATTLLYRGAWTRFADYDPFWMP